MLRDTFGKPGPFLFGRAGETARGTFPPLPDMAGSGAWVPGLVPQGDGPQSDLGITVTELRVSFHPVWPSVFSHVLWGSNPSEAFVPALDHLA